MLASTKSSRILVTFLCTAFLTLAISTQSAMAKKPDREQRAMEDACGKLIGGTPGLYGLCVAYCEAQACDAESADAGHCKRAAPNQRLLDNYNRKKGEHEPDMPCLAPPTSACPCVTEEEAAFTHWVSCSIDDDQVRVSGLQGELLSIDTGASTCELSNTFGIADRYSSLDGQQLDACNNMIELATDYDGIRCEGASTEEDEGLY